MKILKRMMLTIVFVAVALVVVTYVFMEQSSFGRNPSGDRLARMVKSPNYRDGSFQNLEPTPMIAEDASYAGMMYEFFTKGNALDPQKPLPSVKTDLKNIQDETAPVIIWFGHSSYFIRWQHKNILIDPVINERASPVQYAGSKYYLGTDAYHIEDFPDIDLVIISHDHYDHLGYNTIDSLQSKTKLFCVPLGVGSHLERWGVPSEKVREFDWWDSTEVFPGMELIATPARHFSGRGFSRNQTLWSSFVLKTDQHRIFIGGDSGYTSSFKDIGEKYGPFDIAMLESGQYDKQWPYIHMMPEQTAQAAADLKAKTLLPVHWGKFTLALHPWNEPIERVLKKASELSIPVTTPRLGEPVVLGKSYPNTAWWR